MTLHVTPLAWLDAFESVDLNFGPSTTVSQRVHLHRPQMVYASGSPFSPPLGILHTRASSFDSSLTGTVFPKRGPASASDDDLSINCEPACSIGGSAEVTTGSLRVRRSGGTVEISEASLQAVFHSLEAAVPFHVVGREPTEINEDIPLSHERISFLPIEVRFLFRVVNQPADITIRYRSCSSLNPQWPRSSLFPRRRRRLLMSLTVSTPL